MLPTKSQTMRRECLDRLLDQNEPVFWMVAYYQPAKIILCKPTSSIRVFAIKRLILSMSCSDRFSLQCPLAFSMIDMNSRFIKIPQYQGILSSLNVRTFPSKHNTLFSMKYNVVTSKNSTLQQRHLFAEMIMKNMQKFYTICCLQIYKTVGCAHIKQVHVPVL